ncbi:hypothetical protein D3C78_720270 [compost metagenome]
MPARRRDPKIATSEHQCRAVFIGFGRRVEPIAVGRALDVGWADGRKRFLMRAVGAELCLVDVGCFIHETVVETDLLQGREHVHVTATQRLRLQVIQAFAQLAKQLLQSLQETLTLGVHLLAFTQLNLTQRQPQATGQQQGRAERSRQHRQKPRAMIPVTQGLSSSRHH